MTMSAHQVRLHRVIASPLRARREWGSLVNLLPSSTELVAPGALARQGVELLSNAVNTRRFLTALSNAQSHLRDASVPVLVKHPKEAPTLIPIAELSRSPRRWLGQVALELYFTQLFRSEVTLVDLWPSRFGIDEDGDAIWAPKPLYLRWDARFREGLKDVYAGFFLDDRVQFEHGVLELGLAGSADTLTRHFGAGNQRSVRFGTESLRQTLTAMAGQRRPNDAPLHPNFMAFGLYLAALHELLESLDMSFDVRAAFMRSYPGTVHR
jgi:hypothetical protein